MSETANPLRPRLCDACEDMVHEALRTGAPLDFFWCSHTQALAQFIHKDGRITDAMLTAPITKAGVQALFAGAMQTVELQASQMRAPGERVN